MPTTATLPEPGQIVRVRSRQYLVEEVTAGAPATATTAALDSRVRLSCVDDDAQGDDLEVLWERELDAELRTASWQAALHKGFDDPKLFGAWLHTLRWSCVTSTRPELFQAPWRAGIEVKAYQLEPLRKALRLICVNRACPFNGRNPLPILTVDEPIYRRLPCFLVATVDKFAQLP